MGSKVSIDSVFTEETKESTGTAETKAGVQVDERSQPEKRDGNRIGNLREENMGENTDSFTSSVTGPPRQENRLPIDSEPGSEKEQERESGRIPQKSWRDVVLTMFTKDLCEKSEDSRRKRFLSQIFQTPDSKLTEEAYR